MSVTLLIITAERRVRIRREYEMRLRVEVSLADQGRPNCADLWGARLAALDTVDAAMVEVDDSQLNKLAVSWVAEEWDITRENIYPFSDYLLAHVKAGK